MRRRTACWPARIGRHGRIRCRTVFKAHGRPTGRNDEIRMTNDDPDRPLKASMVNSTERAWVSGQGGLPARRCRRPADIISAGGAGQDARRGRRDAYPTRRPDRSAPLAVHYPLSTIHHPHSPPDTAAVADQGFSAVLFGSSGSSNMPESLSSTRISMSRHTSSGL